MLDNCKICSSDDLRVLKSHDVIVCNYCGFGKCRNIPAQKQLNKRYKKIYFKDKKGVSYEKDAKHRFKHLTKYISPRTSVLDFGCGMGQFGILCKKNGVDIVCYDVSKYATKRLRKKERIKAYSQPLTKSLFSKEYFDVIVMFDVIEHIKDFDKILKLFNYWLKPGGVLVISTPNIKSWDAKVFGDKWNSFKKIPQHIYFFSPKSSKLILQKHGFEDVKVKGWGFVRSINFAINDKVWGNGAVINLIRSFLKKTKIGNLYVYFRMLNMLVIAQKKK
jgi:SAM-dependent methyltransferase